MDSEESGLWHWTNLRQSLVARDDLYCNFFRLSGAGYYTVTASFLQGSDDFHGIRDFKAESTYPVWPN